MAQACPPWDPPGARRAGRRWSIGGRGGLGVGHLFGTIGDRSPQRGVLRPPWVPTWPAPAKPRPGCAGAC
eukprot:gene15704-biopygen14279